MTFDVERLRASEFPWAVGGEAIYLNAASTGPLPMRSVAAVNEFTALRATPHLISHELQFGTLERSRALVSRLINARPSEIGLATNTGFGINIAAWSLPLGKGDVVIGAHHEFPANVYPWMAAARQRGYEFRMIPAPGGVPSQDVLLEALRGPGVKAVAISWVGFASGYTFDLETIGAECRERGIFFVVDAIQGLGPRTLDVRATHIDVMASGAQKWLVSPWGTGFTYVREELIQSLEPGFVSWLAVRNADDFTTLVDYDMTWRSNARRFEFLTLPFQEFAGMNASLELMLRIGPGEIAGHTRRLVDRIIDWAAERGVECVTPRDPAHRAGIVALRFADAAARSERLQAAGVTHSLREGAIRLAPYFYNSPGDVERALEVLADPRAERR